MPSAFLSPAPGSSVPEGAPLYLFVPRATHDSLPIVRAAGTPLAVVELGHSPAFSAYAVTLPSTSGQVRITVADHPEAGGEYRVGAGAVTRATAVPIAVRHDSSSWTCSHTEARLITLEGSSASAYRIERANRPELLGTSQGQMDVLPRNVSGFWGARDLEADRAEPPVLALGDVSCLGSTTTSAPDETFYMRVTPLYAIRTEDSLAGDTTSAIYGVSRTEVWRVDLPESPPALAEPPASPRPLAEPPARRPALAPASIRPAQTRATASPDVARLAGLAAGAGALLGLGFALARARRLRRRWVLWIAVLGAGNAALLATLAAASTSWLASGLGALACGLIGGLALGAWARRP